MLNSLKNFFTRLKRVSFHSKNSFYLFVLAGSYSCGSSSSDNGGDSIITGTENIDFLGDVSSSTHQIFNAGAGDDVVSTGSGDDVVRGGLGDDRISTGAGNDSIVIVGVTEESDYSQADIEAVLSEVLSLETLNGQELDEAGTDNIDGGDGIDSLIIYGTTDLTGVTIQNIENISVHSTITIDADTFTSSSVVLRGDGRSVLVIAQDVSLDDILGEIKDFSGFLRLEILDNVTVTVDAREVKQRELLEKFGHIIGKGTGTEIGTGKLQIDSAQGIDLSQITVDENVADIRGGNNITINPSEVENAFFLLDRLTSNGDRIVDTPDKIDDLSTATTTTEGICY